MKDLRDLTLGEIGEVLVSMDVGAVSVEQTGAVLRAIREELARRRLELPTAYFWRRVGLAALERSLEALEAEWIEAAGVELQEGDGPYAS